MADTETTYINEEKVKNIPKEKKKITVKSLAAKSGIAGALTTLATNGLLVFFGNIGEDKIIEVLTTHINGFNWGAGGYPKSETLKKIFQVVRGAVEVNWALVQANPVLAAAVVGAIIAAGGFVIGLGRKIKRKHDVKKGKVVEIEKSQKLAI